MGEKRYKQYIVYSFANYCGTGFNQLRRFCIYDKLLHGVSLTFLLLFSFFIIKYSVQSHQVLFLGTDPKILADTEQVILSTV